MGAKKAKASAKVEGEASWERPSRKLTRTAMIQLYEAQRYFGRQVLEEIGLRMPVEVYFKDPRVAERYKDLWTDWDFTTPWEPGLRDGPTSARFAVVDYDVTTNTLTPPAVWDRNNNCYLAPDGTPLDRRAIDFPQFRQLSVWAILQNTLSFFESAIALGRKITWAFEGNRLIVVPHAGYGTNAYYDRASKSLQFYWFDGDKGRIYTCLSSDNVNHHFGHALLDGLRPYYYESIGAQTAAFHEFVGDLIAIVMAFQRSSFRKQMLEESHSNLDTGDLFSGLALQFGEATKGDPYLRSALNSRSMQSLAGTLEPHVLSEVLTGTMFDILKEVFAKHYTERKISATRAMFEAVLRMQILAIQPLDLLPPCDVTFYDYALAVLRAEQVANPSDPHAYRSMMLDIFIKRGILTEADRVPLMEPAPILRRLTLDVSHAVDDIASSRGGAYRFLDDNRARLFIPPNADLVIPEIVRAKKLTPERRSIPDQIIVQYIWREEVPLEGTRFGRFAGEHTSMLCGATMVLDQNGNLIHWSRKPGSASVGTNAMAVAEQADGVRRRTELLDTIAARVKAGMIGETIGGALGLLEGASPPFGFERADGTIRFQLAPHFSIDAQDDQTGGRQWQISF